MIVVKVGDCGSIVVWSSCSIDPNKIQLDNLETGIYILILSPRHAITENGKVLAKVLAKLSKHFSNLRKAFPNFSRSRQKKLILLSLI